MLNEPFPIDSNQKNQQHQQKGQVTEGPSEGNVPYHWGRFNGKDGIDNYLLIGKLQIMAQKRTNLGPHKKQCSIQF